MDNLHRELAPISDEAWAEIEQEAARTFKRHLAGRRLVDVEGPAGVDLSAVGRGRGVDIHPLRGGPWPRARHRPARRGRDGPAAPGRAGCGAARALLPEPGRDR